jgi:hypothetical protein
MYMELLLPKSEPVIYLNFYWFQKPVTRLTEAVWLSFNPIVGDQQGWTMDKARRSFPSTLLPGEIVICMQ